MHLSEAVKKIIAEIDNRSIREKFCLFHLVLAIGPLLLLGIVLFLQSYSVQEQQTIELLGAVSERAALNFGNYVRMLESELKLMVSTNDIMDLERGMQTRIIRRLLSYENKRHKDVFDALILFDNEGREMIRASRGNNDSKDGRGNRFFESEFHAHVKHGMTHYGRIFRDRASGEAFMTIALPLMSARRGPAGGVLAAKIRLKDVWDLVKDIDAGKSGNIYLLDENGTVIAHKDPSIVSKEVRFPLPAQAGIYPGITGRNVFLAGSMIKFGNRKFYVVTERPVFEALQFTLRIMSVLGIFFVIALAGTVVLGILVRQKIAYPVESLAGAARAISKGDLTRRAAFFSNDELGVLARAFNAMTEKLEMTIDFYRNSITARDAANKELEEQTDRLQTVNRSLNREVAERVKAEDLLRKAVSRAEEEKAKTDAIIAAIGDGISIQDNEFRVIYQNTVHRKMLGDRIGELCYEAYQRKDQACDDCPLKRSMPDGAVRTTERKMSTESGLRDFELTVSPLMDSTGKITACVEVVRDITDRKKTELAVMESEARKSAILKGFDGFLYVCSPDCRIEFMNEHLIDHIGHDATGELCYKTMYDLDSDCPWCANEQVLKGETVRREMQSPKDNRWYYIVKSPIFHPGGRISTQAMIMDITDRKAAEKELLNAKKLESVAILAAGIAHEINNPLTNASLNIQLLKKRQNAGVFDHDFLKKMERIDRNVGKASMIAKELLHFCRKRDLEFRTVNVSDLIDAVLSLVEHKIGKIRVHRNVSKEHCVSGDFARLEQVFINIISNSVDAMPDGGDIFIESAVKGESIEVIVTDTGTGIPEQELQKIFDPFFTTKDIGFGTGLGLSICYGIVRHHNGAIAVSSKEGKGATVAVRLPFTNTHEENTDS